jgi:tRNA(fMet)-specific endonuclease VapC
VACFDTTFFVDLGGRGGAEIRRRALQCLRELEAEGEEAATTRLNVAELLVGVHRSRDPAAQRALTEHTLAGFVIIDFDQAAAEHFGQITAHLAALGRPAGDMDVLIASIALAAGQLLVTRNPRHFADIPGLQTRSY